VAGGRLDPRTLLPLFKPETKEAVTNCKKNATYLSDPLPIEQMCYEIKASPNSKHGLSTYLSKRPESKLESFHDNLSHFGNCGMRDSLCDTLNLCGTARYNLQIRHKRRLAEMDLAQRSTMPAGWEDVVSYDNHSELEWVNQLARDAGCSTVPFPCTETSLPDTGERFFSEYLKDNRPPQIKDDDDRCQFAKCTNNPVLLQHLAANPLPSTPTTTTPSELPDTETTTGKEDHNNDGKTPIINPQQQQQQQQHAPPKITPQQVHHTVHIPTAPHQSTVVAIMPNTYPVTPWAPSVSRYHQQNHWYQHFQPMVTHNPMHQAFHSASNGYCCIRCYHWCVNLDRKGRPPHDAHCRIRMGNKRKRIEEK